MTDMEREVYEMDELCRKEFEESYYNSSSIFSQGRYELLWASFGEEHFLQSAQNAEIKNGDLLKPSVRWVDGKIGGTVECVDITILEEGKKLSDIFYTTPYGVVKKNVTGIGATTLELRCERNSIIVVPTKALAYEKYKTGIDSETGVSRFLYVGSDMESVRAPSDDDISAYINSSVPFKKILVVADSLYKVLRHITIAEWFLMVDEIDIYQSDSVFRPSLENVIDYYFEFPCYAEVSCICDNSAFLSSENSRGAGYQYQLFHSEETSCNIDLFQKSQWLGYQAYHKTADGTSGGKDSRCIQQIAADSPDNRLIISGPATALCHIM